MAQDKRQVEFPFLPSVEEQEGTQKLKTMFRTGPWDCSNNKHQMLPNGTCRLCKQQVEHV